MIVGHLSDLLFCREFSFLAGQEILTFLGSSSSSPSVVPTHTLPISTAPLDLRDQYLEPCALNLKP